MFASRGFIWNQTGDADPPLGGQHDGQLLRLQRSC